MESPDGWEGKWRLCVELEKPGTRWPVSLNSLHCGLWVGGGRRVWSKRTLGSVPTVFGVLPHGVARETESSTQSFGFPDQIPGVSGELCAEPRGQGQWAREATWNVWTSGALSLPRWWAPRLPVNLLLRDVITLLPRVDSKLLVDEIYSQYPKISVLCSVAFTKIYLSVDISYSIIFFV